MSSEKLIIVPTLDPRFDKSPFKENKSFPILTEQDLSITPKIIIPTFVSPFEIKR